MKKAIIILTCPKFTARAQACRDTWAATSLIPVHFLTGADLGCHETDDEYRLLPRKTAAMVKWALDMKFDRVWKCDDDVMVVPENIQAPAGSDYSGLCLANHPHATFARGFFYHLSRRALEILASDPPAPERLWAEDRWVARSLYVAGIEVVADERIFYVPSATFRGRSLKNIHPKFCAAAEFTPEEMRQFSQELRSGNFWKDRFLRNPQYTDWLSERRAYLSEKKSRFRDLELNI